MYIIIVGAGKVGYNLTKLLLADRHEALLIEVDPHRIPNLADEFGDAVLEGNGSRVTVLQEAGANRADVLVAVTGRDEDNLVICQIAKTVFKVRRTIARVNDPKNEDLFSTLGIDATVSSTRRINTLIQEQMGVDDTVIPLLTLKGGDVVIVEVDLSPAAPAVGKRVRDLPLPADSIIISILRGDDVLIPKGETEFKSKDRVIALVKRGNAALLKRLF